MGRRPHLIDARAVQEDVRVEDAGRPGEHVAIVGETVDRCGNERG